MTIGRPLHELDLAHQFRSQPPALLDLYAVSPSPQRPPGGLWQVGERAGFDRQPTEQLGQMLA